MHANGLLSERGLNSIVALIVLFMIVYRGMIAFSYAPELVNGESNNIWNAIKVSNGSPIYTDPKALPLEIFQYTPLSQLPIIVAASVFDASDSDYVHNITVVGRLSSLLLNVLTALLFYMACQLLVTTDRWIIGIGCLLGFMSFTHSTFAIRPDATSFFLMMTAFYFFARHTASDRVVHLMISASVLALAFMAKQDAMVIVAPLSLTLLLRGKWKQLILFDLVFLTALGALLLVGHIVLGEHFLMSIVMGVNNPNTIQQVVTVLLRLIDLYPFHFFAANTAILVSLWHYRSRPELIPLALTALFFEGFAMITSAKIGSWVNYYIPFLLFSSVLMPILLVKLWSQHIPTVRQKAAILLVVGSVSGIFIFRQAHAFTSPFLKYSAAKAQYEHLWNDLQQVSSELQLKPDDRIMVVDPLSRVMMARNTIMPNIEYYGISPFDYSQFKEKETDKVDFILFAPTDEASMDYLMDFFHVDRAQFMAMGTATDLIVLSRRRE